MGNVTYVKKAKCPLCGTELLDEEDEVYWTCPNEICPVVYVTILDEDNVPITKEES